MIAGIYKFVNKLNGMVYIGQSICIPTRMSRHLSGKSSNSEMAKDLNDFGIENFKFEVLEFISQSEDMKPILNERELFYINAHSGFILYNRVLNPEEGSLGLKLKSSISEIKTGVPLSTEHRESLKNALKLRKKSKKYKKDNPKIKNPSEKRRNKARSVCQYDLDGVHIGTFNSQSDAAEHINGGSCNINKCLKGNVKSAYGYMWRFKDESNEKDIKPYNDFKISVLDYNKNPVGDFSSVNEAAIHTGLSNTRVLYAMNNSKYNYSNGYYFFKIYND